MPADRKALTIVTAFVGIVMVSFWIAHACALYCAQQPGPAPQFDPRLAQIGGGLT